MNAKEFYEKHELEEFVSKSEVIRLLELFLKEQWIDFPANKPEVEEEEYLVTNKDVCVSCFIWFKGESWSIFGPVYSNLSVKFQPLPK